MMKKKMRKNNLTYYLGSFLVIGLILVGIAGVDYFQKQKNQNQENQAQLEDIISEKVEVCETLKKVDGLCYDSEEEPGIYAVMIENHVDARPQSGLAQASLVYEAVVEAPITRFLAIFSTDNDIEKIGPVRSARPFYVEWAIEFSGLYAHVGGSNEALDLISKVYPYDLNEFSSGKYFWRAWTRSQPHNVYTSSELILKAIKDKNWEIENNFESWIFKPELGYSERGDTEKIKIDYATNNFLVEWVYDKENNQYVRYQAGELHKDGNNDQILAKNVAVIYTESTVIDDYGRRKTKTIGSGDAMVFLDGNVFQGIWKRPTLDSRTRFYDENMNELAFNSGNTWIEVVPTHYPDVVVQESLAEIIQ